jgi:predicted  nucleic acid-binding Zn-ribbon protein
MNFITNTITSLLLTGMVLCGTQTLFSQEDEQPTQQSNSMNAMQELIAAFKEAQTQEHDAQPEPETNSSEADTVQPSNITEDSEVQQDADAQQMSIEQPAVEQQAIEVQAEVVVEQQENQVENQLT